MESTLSYDELITMVTGFKELASVSRAMNDAQLVSVLAQFRKITADGQGLIREIKAASERALQPYMDAVRTSVSIIAVLETELRQRAINAGSDILVDGKRVAELITSTSVVIDDESRPELLIWASRLFANGATHLFVPDWDAIATQALAVNSASLSNEVAGVHVVKTANARLASKLDFAIDPAMTVDSILLGV